MQHDYYHEYKAQRSQGSLSTCCKKMASEEQEEYGYYLAKPEAVVEYKFYVKVRRGRYRYRHPSTLNSLPLPSPPGIP